MEHKRPLIKLLIKLLIDTDQTNTYPPHTHTKKKQVLALSEQLDVSGVLLEREQTLSSQLYYAKRHGAAVTAGEIAFRMMIYINV